MIFRTRYNNGCTRDSLHRFKAFFASMFVVAVIFSAVVFGAMPFATSLASSDDQDSPSSTPHPRQQDLGEGNSTYSNTSSDTAAYDFAYNTSVDYRSIRENAIEFSLTDAVNNMLAINNGDLFLSNIFVYNQTQQKSVVLVDKSNLTVYIGAYGGSDGDGSNTLEMLDAFDVLVGEAAGDKVREGDRKTPEGVYYAVDYLSNRYLSNKYGSSVGNIYGTGAFPINYPNIVDKIEGRGGSGIWIHGLNPDKHKPVTLGCVAMGNERFARLMEHVSVGVATIIGETLNFTQNEEAYEASRSRYYSFLTTFTNAWKENDYNTYESMFHNDFRTPSGVRRGSFLSRKKGIMDYGLSLNTNLEANTPPAFGEASQPTLADIRRLGESTKGNKLITFDNLTVFVEQDHIVYDFNQLYATANLVSYGNKRYYVKDTPEGLRLLSEEFISKGAAARAEVVMPYVETFLQQWATAWQEKDADAYISMYAKGFRQNGMGIRQFANYKRNLFARAGNISVEYSDVAIESMGGGRVRVSFVQTYTSDTISDTGKKTLVLTGKPDYLSIRSESWVAL